MKQIWLELTLVFVAMAAISGLATAYVNHSGWTLYYGDAEAHLNIARRIIDSRRPGYNQIGTVWLPLPHLLMLALVRNPQLWRSGLAGAIPSSVCFVCAGVFLYAALRRATQSSAAALASLGLLAFNPNLLYLQATPMTETVVLAALMALLYFTVLFRETQSFAAVAGAGLASVAASLARYEGWFVIPFVALYFLFTARKNKLGAALLFSGIAALAPLYWFGHNWWLYSNPLEFFNGPYSPTSIYRRALAQNMAPYPGDHDWRAAAFYYLTAVRLFSGWVAVVIGIAGLVGVFQKRLFWPVLLAALPPSFYIWSMHSGGTPIYVVAFLVLQHALRAHCAPAHRNRRRLSGSGSEHALASVAGCGDSHRGRGAVADSASTQRLGHLERIANQLAHSPCLDSGRRAGVGASLSFAHRDRDQFRRPYRNPARSRNPVT